VVRSSRRRACITPVIASALAMLAPGCGGGSDPSSATSTPSVDTIVRVDPKQASASLAQIIGGSPRQRDELMRIARGVVEPSMTQIRVHRASTGWQPSPRLRAVGHTWLSVRMKPGSSGPDQIKSTWVAALVAGAFRDRSHGTSLPEILGYTPILELPGRKPLANGQLIGGRQSHSTNPADVDTLSDSVKHALSDASDRSGGFSRVRLAFLKPTNFALFAEITARSPERAAKFFYENKPFMDLEGYLVVVRDGSGRPAFAQAYATRANYGAIWLRDG
jgi:hypothetical protein